MEWFNETVKDILAGVKVGLKACVFPVFFFGWPVALVALINFFPMVALVLVIGVVVFGLLVLLKFVGEDHRNAMEKQRQRAQDSGFRDTPDWRRRDDCSYL